jgi:hypothetical protein
MVQEMSRNIQLLSSSFCYLYPKKCGSVNVVRMYRMDCLRMIKMQAIAFEAGPEKLLLTIILYANT